MGNRIGEEKLNKFGSKMKIVDYRNAKDIDVYFEEYNWVAKNKQYYNFKIGNIKCPYEPKVYNSGYLGEGKYKCKENGKTTRIYNTWNSMIERCCSQKFKNKNHTYSICKVCDEWLNFQNFAKWYEENYYEVENESMHLDKDILVKGNKIYSPNTCVFVPQSINNLFVKSNSTRGIYPIGVYYRNDINKFTSEYTNKNKTIKLGYFNTPEEAFHEYKKFKENYIKEVADKYKDKIPENLYNALYKYEVEIND